MFIYDNFNMDFKVAQPTAAKVGSHTSMMSATFAPYAQGSMSEDLKFTMQLHTTSQFNKDNLPGSPAVYTPHIWDVMPQPKILVNGFDSLYGAFAWHLWAILIQQDQSFERYKQHLGLLDAIDPLSRLYNSQLVPSIQMRVCMMVIGRCSRASWSNQWFLMSGWRMRSWFVVI